MATAKMAVLGGERELIQPEDQEGLFWGRKGTALKLRPKGRAEPKRHRGG